MDDDPVFRELAGRLLSAIGLNVAGEADTAAEAMSIAMAVKPDAALIDVELPDEDGIELARKLSALAWRPRVVLTSVDADAAGPDAIRRSGASAFVHKPELPNAPLGRLLAAD